MMKIAWGSDFYLGIAATDDMFVVSINEAFITVLVSIILEGSQFV